MEESDAVEEARLQRLFSKIRHSDAGTDEVITLLRCPEDLNSRSPISGRLLIQSAILAKCYRLVDHLLDHPETDLALTDLDGELPEQTAFEVAEVKLGERLRNLRLAQQESDRDRWPPDPLSYD